MGKRVDLSTIIVNYNTKKLLRQCLKSLISNIKYQKLNMEIIVVDNGSKDGSVEYIKNQISNILPAGRHGKYRKLKLRAIFNKKNLGFAKANNQGIRKAQGEYILLLNPDTVVYKKTLSTLISYLDKHPEVGIVTCRVELPDGKLDDACHRGFPTPWNAFCHFSGLEKLFPKARIFSGYSLGYLPQNVVHEIDSCCGAFLLTKREVLEKVGLLDESFFWYGEDLDLCFRTKEAGLKIIFYPKVKIMHYKGASSGIKKSSQDLTAATDKTRRMAVVNSVKAMRIFYEKHYQDKYPKVITWLVNLGVSLLLKVRLMKTR